MLILGIPQDSRSAQQAALRGTKLTSTEMQQVERRLSELGFWIESPDGIVDESTLSSITAFRRVNGYQLAGSPGPTDLPYLQNARPLDAVPTGEAYFEVDLKRQIMFHISPEGIVDLILPVSTGSGRRYTDDGKRQWARTPIGRFSVYRKVAGWRRSTLGQMYYPSYLIGGVAIHGSLRVADHPITYGCVAVPLFAAKRLSKLMPVGTVVDIHA